MATVIRLSRFGKKKKPFYRVVVADSRSPRDGKYLEHIGFLNPMGEETFDVKRDRLEYWLAAGAQLSDSVRTRLKKRMPEVVKGAAAAAPVKAAPKAPQDKAPEAKPEA